MSLQETALEARVRALGAPAGSNELLRSLGCQEGTLEAAQAKVEAAKARIAVGRVLYETQGLDQAHREREVRSRLGIELAEAQGLLGDAQERELQTRDHIEERTS